MRLDLTNHLRVRKNIRMGDGVVKDVQDEWSKDYAEFIVNRFDKFSMGGGNWKRLKPATVRAKKKNKDVILVHSKFMRMKLKKGVKVLRRERNAVVVGFDMKMQHPDADLTVQELASIHDLGQGVPKRRILVLPDDPTKKKMRETASREFAKDMNGRRR